MVVLLFYHRRLFFVTVRFYWICSTVISFLQSWLLSTYYSPAYLTAKSEAQHVALLELKEAKVKYNYQPVSAPAENDNKNKNTKNKWTIKIKNLQEQEELLEVLREELLEKEWAQVEEGLLLQEEIEEQDLELIGEID